jgi:hypothetical protein
VSGGTSSQSGPDYLELGGRPPGRRRRGLLLAVVATVAVALGLPLGAFAVFRLLGGGGPQPHDVLPANTLAYVRVDLDPSAPQKVDALRFLRTFPAFEAVTGIHDERADVREVLLDAAVGLGECGLGFDADAAGWLGHRLGVALTPPAVAGPSTGASAPGVAVAVQVRDERAARGGLRRLDDCVGGRRRFGWTFLDGYAILAESSQQARFHAAAAARAPLAGNARFATDMRRLGEPGVASVWFSGEDLYQSLVAGMVGDPGPAGSEFDRLRDRARLRVVRGFRSGAVAFRFGEGYAELAAVLTGTGYRAPRGRAVADLTLPDSTAVAVGLGRRLPGGGLQTLSRVMQRLRATATRHGVLLDPLVRRTGDGAVLALDRGTADRPAAGGSLEDTDAFRAAVPEAAHAQAVLFADLAVLGAPLRAELARSGVAGALVADNLTRLRAVGLSAGCHDGYATATLRLTIRD